MNFADYIQNRRGLLKDHIENIFKKKIKSSPADLPTNEIALKILQKNVPKGKLLRGIQLILGFEMAGGKPDGKIYDAAAAIEILHTSLLIQDDVMDNDFTRRGERSVLAVFADAAQKQSLTNSLLYGQSIAVCIGDIGFFLGNELIETNTAVAGMIARELQFVCAGQMMDIDIAHKNTEPGEDEIMAVYTYKTARYSFSLPLCAGAVFGGADASTVKKLETLGILLGLIFQIKDDELNLFSDETKIGKPVGSDVRENKKTLYRLELMKRSAEKDNILLSEIFGNRSITKNQIEFVQNRIHVLGIHEDILKKIESMKKEADTIIGSLTVDKKFKNLLKEFSASLLKRNK